MKINNVLKALDGLWISFSVTEKNNRKLYDHQYYTKENPKILLTNARRTEEQTIAEWVLSSNFLKNGFDHVYVLIGTFSKFTFIILTDIFEFK